MRNYSNGINFYCKLHPFEIFSQNLLAGYSQLFSGEKKKDALKKGCPPSVLYVVFQFHGTVSIGGILLINLCWTTLL